MTNFKSIHPEKIKKILTSSKGYINIYSAQNIEDIKRCQKQGYLSGQNPEIYMNDIDDSIFTIPYKWIYQKMSEKTQNFSGDWPIWAWPKRWNIFQYRKYMYSLKDKDIFKNTILVYAKVPISRILINDYDLWHSILNKSPVTWTEEEDKYYYPSLGTKKTQEEIQKTWDRIFDIEWPENIDPQWLGNPNKRSFQICVDRIYFDEITKIRTIKNKKDIKKTFF